jgi:acetyltransferase-like isoleucine patch superfamily enzyme
MSKASREYPFDPLRVSGAMIDRCRRELEGPAKKMTRKLISPLVKSKYGFIELGEGFQWGLPLGVPRNQVRVGRYVYIGAHGVMIGPVVIGDLCMLSTHVRFIGNDHKLGVVGSPMRLEFSRERPTTIVEADCWIGQGAMIFEGVRIGRGAVVAAGAIVTRSVEPYTVVAGVPARLIRMRFTEAEIEANDAALFGEDPK